MTDPTPTAAASAIREAPGPRPATADDLALARPETRQIHRVHIAASAERIWQAITDPDWTVRYGFGGRTEYEPRAGGRMLVHAPGVRGAVDDNCPADEDDLIIEGHVTAWEPPRRLAVTQRFFVDEQSAAEPATHVSYEIADCGGGVHSLTVVHETAGAPTVSLIVSGDLEDRGFSGGHPFNLSDLKSLLETGRTLREQAAATEQR